MKGDLPMQGTSKWHNDPDGKMKLKTTHPLHLSGDEDAAVKAKVNQDLQKLEARIRGLERDPSPLDDSFGDLFLYANLISEIDAIKDSMVGYSWSEEYAQVLRNLKQSLEDSRKRAKNTNW